MKMKKIYRSLLYVASVFMLLLIAQAAVAQTRTITGTVTEETGAPMPGVNVVVKGTTNGTTTDGNGAFSIEAADDAVLVASFIGYVTQEKRVGTLTKIDFQLQEDIATLQEVVVVGYGTMKREDLTTAQTSVNKEQIQRTVNTTLEQAIQGRAAGVLVTQNTGQPGGGISVNIRGVSSLNFGTQPLYVVDGIQIQNSSDVNFGSSSSSNPLAGLNPADVEDIQILQGPSATSVYGSRATNGVVLITTKRGKKGETEITYGTTYSIQTPPKRMDVMNLRQFATMVGELNDYQGSETPDIFKDPSLLGKGTDWQDELFRNSALQMHQISLSGGSEKTRYYFSGEYTNHEGVALGSGFKRYGARLNLENDVRDWLKLGALVNYNQTRTKLTTSQENIIVNALQISPQVPVKNLDGTWGGGDPVNGANQFTPANPIALARLTQNEVLNNEVNGAFNVKITPLKGLTVSTLFTTRLGFSSSRYYEPKYDFGYQERPINKLTERQGYSAGWNWNQQIEYTRSFGKHSFTVMALHEAQESMWKNVMGQRTGFLVDQPLDLNLGDRATSIAEGGNGDWAMESYLGRVNYNFNDRYIFQAALRRDGSVNFGENNKWGTFPSFSAGWRISQEPFFNIPFVNELKLRFDGGLTGNQGSVSGIYSPMGAVPTAFGTGFAVTRYSNPNLKWEETWTNNFGINVAFLENRIQFEADYFTRNTSNLLMTIPLPDYMGVAGQGSVGAPIVNVGELENKGFTFTLKTVNMNTGAFKWETDFNISFIETEIEKFYTNTAVINRSSWWMDNWTQTSRVGETPWQFFGYEYDGIFKTLDEVENSPRPNLLPVHINNGVWVGDFKYKDRSGPEGEPDGIIDAYDMTTIGNPWPKIFGGFNNKFSYKGFTLDLNVIYSQGNDIYNNLARINTNPNNINLSRNMMIEAFEYAKLVDGPDGPLTALSNPGTNVARLGGRNDNYNVHSTRWVEDGSYVRLKSVNLTYWLPKSIISKTKVIRNASVSVGGQNLLTWTKYTGFDPEVGAYVGRDAGAGNQAIGVDNGRYPLTRTYTFKLNLTF
jgi:TonB-dependent starch-binding outer membrane protein SusC